MEVGLATFVNQLHMTEKRGGMRMTRGALQHCGIAGSTAPCGAGCGGRRPGRRHTRLMQGPLAGVVGFGAVLVLIAIRVPVAIAMGVVGALGYGIVNGWSSLPFVLGRAPFESVFPVSLSVLPLFIMIGSSYACHVGPD